MPNFTTMNQDAAIEKLLSRGVINRTDVRGRYTIVDQFGTYTRGQILSRFATQPIPGRYVFVVDEIYRALGPAPTAQALRKITRGFYHGYDRAAGIATALASIAPDDDGVVRSFGIEYEVYALTDAQEDKLARLLDTLPAHFCERDGSLDSTGVEIVFMPLGAQDYIKVVTTLASFIRENGIQMSTEDERHMAGMHTTYGVSNAEAAKSDLQIRLNRFALAVKAVSTVGKIKSVFGRDFGGYRTMPQTLTETTHGNAFSTNGRPANCWECRLSDWRCNPEAMVNFFKATEVAFHRPVNCADFVKVFEVMGVTE